MRVDAAGGDDLAFPGDDFGPRSDDDLDPGLDVGIPRLADRGDPAAAQRDVGLVDAAVNVDKRLGYHRVEIGSTACRERVGTEEEISGGDVYIKKKKKEQYNT